MQPFGCTLKEKEITMEYEELKNYLKDVYTLESQLYTHRCTTQKYKNEIELWEQRKTSDCVPVKNGKWLPYSEVVKLLKDNLDYDRELPDEVRKKINDKKTTLKGRGHDLDFLTDHPIISSAIISLILSTIIYFVLNNGEFLFIPIFIIVRILLFVMLIFQGRKSERWLKQYKEMESGCLYEELPKYRQQCQDSINDMDTQLRANVLTQENQTKELLQYIYSQDIIHPKYRNFLAIAQIYEYLDTGRCTELSGPNGAYNLYEQELRQNIIIDRLDQIINQLDRLNRTMGYVACVVTQTNQLLGDISNSLGRIEANTALTAYNTQCIASNTSIANRYNYR